MLSPLMFRVFEPIERSEGTSSSLKTLDNLYCNLHAPATLTQGLSQTSKASHLGNLQLLASSMVRISILVLASFFGDELKYMLMMSSDSLGRNSRFSVLKIMVEMLERRSCSARCTAPLPTSQLDFDSIPLLLRFQLKRRELGKGISHLSARIQRLNSYLKAFSVADSSLRPIELIVQIIKQLRTPQVMILQHQTALGYCSRRLLLDIAAAPDCSWILQQQTALGYCSSRLLLDIAAEGCSWIFVQDVACRFYSMHWIAYFVVIHYALAFAISIRCFAISLQYGCLVEARSMEKFVRGTPKLEPQLQSALQSQEEWLLDFQSPEEQVQQTSQNYKIIQPLIPKSQQLDAASDAVSQVDQLLGKKAVGKLNHQKITLKRKQISGQMLPLQDLAQERTEIFGLQKIAPEFRQKWREMFTKTRALFRTRSTIGKKNWVEYQKKLLVEFIEKGHRYGLSRQHLMDLVGVSRVSWSKWHKRYNLGQK